MIETLQAYNNREDRAIKGVGILKQVDGRNSFNDEEVSKDKQYFVIGTAVAAQCLLGGKVDTKVQKPDEPPIDIDLLKSTIPQKEWELGLDGKPRAPWAMNFIVYLFDPEDGSVYTTINSSFGMRLAFDNLTEKVHYMRKLRGANLVPIVKFSSVTMKTKFGTKQRPEFKVVEWRNMNGESSEPKAIGKPVTPITTKELVGEDID